MHIERLLSPLSFLFALSTATPLATAAEPPTHNRRVVAFDLRPSPIVPGTYDAVAVLAWARVDGPSSLDLSTDVQLFANGAPAPLGYVHLQIQFGPASPICSTDGCLSLSTCATIAMDGSPLFGTCRVLPPHPGDDAPSCGCTGVAEVAVAQQLALVPGDELELVLSATPNAAPEIQTSDDTWRMVVPTQDVLSYCEGDETFGGCPCFNIGFAGQGCRNSTGAGALLSTLGTTSVAADDLRFRNTNLSPLKPMLLFAGTMRINSGHGLPFGDGLRCAGGSVERLGVLTSDGAGTTTYGPGLLAAHAWVAGDIWFVQSWYRDPAGPCGSGVNLSNALEVHVTP